MTIVMALIFPARFYFVFNGSNITLVFAIAFAIFAGYIYMLLASISAIINKKTIVTGKYFKNAITGFLKSYILAIIYISFIVDLLILCNNCGLEINEWISRTICLIVAWSIGKVQFLRKRSIYIPIVVSTIVISLMLGVSPISVDFENYILTILLLLCQTTIRTNIYENISIKDLNKGMILSMMSSLMMQSSITKGLPSVSTEDLKSRLTIEEVESIKIWAKATQTENITIVKKIPFAIFIAIGFVSYFVIGSWRVY